MMHYIRIAKYDGSFIGKYHVEKGCDFVSYEKTIGTFCFYEDALKFAKMKSTELGLSIRDVVELIEKKKKLKK